jgi:cytochrome bd-type quinol oxidase subunit 2
MSETPARGWDAVEHAEERLQTRAMARERAAQRRRRARGGVVWTLRVLLPIAGAAAVLAVLQDAGGDLARWSQPKAIAVPAAILVVPALVSAVLARRDGPGEALLWGLVTLAAELALVFAVGLVALGLGPN